MNNKRLTYLDLAKGIGIILVVLGHLEYISEDIRGFIYAFHMPLFFVISGILMALKNETDYDYKILFKKKALALLVPYMWFSLLYIPIDIMNVFIHHIDMNTFLFNIISSIIFSGVGVLWFLPALFIAEAGAFIIFKTLKRSYIIIPVTCIMSVLLYLLANHFVPMIEPDIKNIFFYIINGLIRVLIRGLVATIFIIAGFYSYKWALCKKESFSIIQLIAGILFIAITFFLFSINGCVDLHYLILNNIVIYFPLAIIASVGVVLISKNMCSIKLIEFYGKNSLTIMATHIQCYILYVAIKLSEPLLQMGPELLGISTLFIASTVIIVFAIETVIIIIINKFFSFLIGKNK